MEHDWVGMRARLAEYHQEHLLQHLDQLNEAEQAVLYADISQLNLKKLTRCWERAKEMMSNSGEVKDESLKPLDSSIVGSTARDKEDVLRWADIGRITRQITI